VIDLETYDGRPTYLFVGIDTGGSRVHREFPKWGLDADLHGVDLPEDAPPEAWRRLVGAMRDNPNVLGAVITSHKLRLYRHAAGLIDEAEPLVEVTHEVNALDTRGPVRAFARDAQALDVLLNGPGKHLADGRPIVCLGSGGAAIALVLATQTDVAATVEQGRVVARRGPAMTVVGRWEESLADVRAVLVRAGIDVPLKLAPDPEACAEIVAAAGPEAIVVNATGLGKSAPGSPLPDAFPRVGAAWDFNYRGPLTFLAQAERAGVPTENGWDYFLAGWACALAAITGRDATETLTAFRRAV
jgi:shikimate dehydrogenase